MLQEYIKKYTEQGIKIFACNKDKTPATRTGFYSASTNIDVLQQQFKSEDMLIGIPTGTMNKIVVIDIDVGKPDDPRSRDELLEALREFGELPDTYTVETPSGGLHLYYTCLFTELNSKRRFFDKSLSVDIRANGGYVCAVDGKNYEVYDDAEDQGINNIYDRCAQLPEWIENFKPQEYNEPLENILPESEIKEIRSALSYISSDDRDTWIRIGMCLKATGSPSAYGLWNEWSQTSDKYNPKEMEKRWKGLKPSELTIASLFHEAQKNGWVTTYNTGEKEKNEDTIKPEKIDFEFLKKKYDVKQIKKEFPKHLLRPDGLVGDMAEYINYVSIKQQPILAIGASLAAIGALAGRKVTTNTSIRTNIYCLNVGASGCGKESARRIIKKCFQEAGCGQLASSEDLASDASVITALKKNPSQVFLLDEIGRFLKTTRYAEKNPHISSIITVLLRLYGSCDQKFYGKDYADADRKVEIEQPNLCLLGTTVPETLYKGLTVENITDGFMSRLIIFESENPNPPKQSRTRIATPPPKELLDKISLLNEKKINMRPIGNLDHLEPNPQIVELTSPALKMIESFEQEIREQIDFLIEHDRPSAVYNRTVQIAEQIALIIASGINIYDPVITEQEMSYGIEMMRFLSERLLYISENYVVENEHERYTKTILNLVRKNGFISAAALSRRTQHLQSYIRNGIIETLIEGNQIFEQWEGEGSKKKKIYVAV